MSSPFSVFRKHQKGLMAGLIIVAMISFIVLGTVEQFLGRGGGDGPRDNRVVATWKGGKFTERDLDQIRYHRISLNNFIRSVAETEARNRGYQVREPLAYQVDDRSLVISQVLVELAKQLGIVVTDDQVSQTIRGLSDDSVSNDQLNAIVRNLSDRDRPVTYAQIIEAFRRELMAGQAQVVFGSPGQTYDYRATPAERWDYFCRLERRITLQAYPFPVERYLADRRIPEPSDEQLAAFYDKYKDQVASPMSPEPGFKLPDGVKLEYLKADYVKFFDAAKTKITEDEIRADFEKRKEKLRASLEFAEQMREYDDEADRLEAEQKAKNAGQPVVKAPEPNPTPYEEAVGRFAKRAPRATEPRLTDEEILHRSRDEIVKRLAQERARSDMRQALDSAYEQMSRADSEYRRWARSSAAKNGDGGSSSSDQPTSSPPTFDLAKLANPDAGLTYHQTTLMSHEEMAYDKYLRSTFVNRRWKKTKDALDVERMSVEDKGTQLPDYAFQSKTKMSPFRAEDEIGGAADPLYHNQYVIWIVDVRKEHIPALAEIEDKVRRAWKIANDTGKSARDLARAEAERLAQEINGNRDTLKNRFDNSGEVRETGEFTWYEDRVLPTGSMPFPEFRLRPEITELDEIPSAGDRFFREVFRLTDRLAGVAMDDAGAAVYTVQVFDAPDAKADTLREKFLKTPFSRIDRNMPNEQGYVLASENDMLRQRNAWREQLERDFELKWEPVEEE